MPGPRLARWTMRSGTQYRRAGRNCRNRRHDQEGNSEISLNAAALSLSQSNNVRIRPRVDCAMRTRLSQLSKKPLLQRLPAPRDWLRAWRALPWNPCPSRPFPRGTFHAHRQPACRMKLRLRLSGGADTMHQPGRCVAPWLNSNAIPRRVVTKNRLCIVTAAKRLYWGWQEYTTHLSCDQTNAAAISKSAVILLNTKRRIHPDS